MDRQPIVSGQFYPGTPESLDGELAGFLAQAEDRDSDPTILAMVPHAGYVFSGGVCGKTLGRANLHPTVVLLGPNHTGQGARLAVWPDGKWLFPGGGLEVDSELALEIMEADSRFTADRDAHLNEHSLEVILPFLAKLDPATRIVPICVAEPNPDALLEAGRAIASVLSAEKRAVSIVVSSDMSHYVSHDKAREQDVLAIKAACDLKPLDMYRVVREKGISMCGVLPMTLGLHAAKGLGARKAELVAYATSGEVNRDFSKVVGYAGILVS